MVHQDFIIYGLYDSEEIVRYLDKMEEEIKLYEAQNKTGNEVLDTILTSKAMALIRDAAEVTTVTQ